MNFNDYVLMEHAVRDRLHELRRAAAGQPREVARPADRGDLRICAISGWSRARARRFGPALLRALGVVGILAVAATALG